MTDSCERDTVGLSWPGPSVKTKSPLIMKSGACLVIVTPWSFGSVQWSGIFGDAMGISGSRRFRLKPVRYSLPKIKTTRAINPFRLP